MSLLTYRPDWKWSPYSFSTPWGFGLALEYHSIYTLSACCGKPPRRVHLEEPDENWLVVVSEETECGGCNELLPVRIAGGSQAWDASLSTLSLWLELSMDPLKALLTAQELVAEIDALVQEFHHGEDNVS